MGEIAYGSSFKGKDTGESPVPREARLAVPLPLPFS
jgi:hypothetical protein